MYQYLDIILIILGGLIKNVEGKATIIGIISWGISKCPVGRPGIYTNVAKFSNWIEKIMSDTSTNGTTDTATTDSATTETTTTIGCARCVKSLKIHQTWTNSHYLA